MMYGIIDAFFFVAGSMFGLLCAKNVPHTEKPILPQGVKRDSLDAQIKAVWNTPRPVVRVAKEEGTVVMPERADISNKDLKIDDLLQ